MTWQQTAGAGGFAVEGNLAEAVLAGAGDRGDRPALWDLDGGGAIGFARLARTVRAAARGLRRHGLRTGDSVGVDLLPSPAGLTAAYAVLAAGGVLTPVGADPDADAAALSARDTRLLLAAPGRADVATALAERSRVRQILTMDAAPGTTSFAGLTDDLDDAAADTTAARGSGGAAGGPPCAGVPGISAEVPALWAPGAGRARDHRALGKLMARLARLAPIAEPDTVLVAGPAADGAGLVAVVSLALARGATVLTAGDMDARRCRRVVTDRGVRLAVVPAPVVRALGTPRLPHDLPSLTGLLSPAPFLLATADAPTPRPADALR